MARRSTVLLKCCYDHLEWWLLILTLLVLTTAIVTNLIPDQLVCAVAPEPRPGRDLSGFARGFLLLVTIAALYCFLCIIAILYFVRAACRTLGYLSSGVCIRTLGFLGFALGVASSLSYIHAFHSSCLTISEILLSPTFHMYIYVKCVGISESFGQLLVFVPTLCGSVTAVGAAFHSAVVTKNWFYNAVIVNTADNRHPNQGTEKLDRRMESNTHGMLVLSAVLVASVLLLSLHVHMHGALYAGSVLDDHGTFANFVSIASGLGLTILATLIYLPSWLLIRFAPTRNASSDGRARRDILRAIAGVAGPLIAAILAQVADKVLS